MSSQLDTQHTAGSEPTSTAAAAVAPTAPEDAAVHNERKASIFNDPLWGMAIASGILFAALAALIASG